MSFMHRNILDGDDVISKFVKKYEQQINPYIKALGYPNKIGSWLDGGSFFFILDSKIYCEVLIPDTYDEIMLSFFQEVSNSSVKYTIMKTVSELLEDEKVQSQVKEKILFNMDLFNSGHKNVFSN